MTTVLDYVNLAYLVISLGIWLSALWQCVRGPTWHGIFFYGVLTSWAIALIIGAFK